MASQDAAWRSVRIRFGPFTSLRRNPIVDSILKLVPYGENLAGDVIETAQVVRVLEGLEASLQQESLQWSDASLLVLLDSKQADSDKHQHDSNESVKAGIEQFCGDRGWYPPLIGSSVFGSFFRHRDQSQPEINDGLLFIACASAVLTKIPVAYEITKNAPERRLAGQRVLGQGVQRLRKQMQDSLGVEIPPLTVTESSIGLIFTTGSGHIETQEFIDFKDCYAAGQALVKAAAENGAQLFGGCATNRTSAQLQCLYYSEEIGARTHYRCTYRHGAVLAFLPYTRAQAHLRHPYRPLKVDQLDIEFHDRDRYAEGRCFYVRRINGQAPIDFLADYWEYSVDELRQMADDHTPIPSEPGAHLVTIASSLNRFDETAWPNVPIWLDREGDEILLRLVRAEADDGNYYLMEMKPEYLADNAGDLMASMNTNVSEESSLLAFLCESRKYVLDSKDSNAEAEAMLAEAPERGALVGIYLNGEYSTGAPTSIGYHNYSQIGAIIPRRPIDSLPANITQARRASSLEIFLCHASRDKPTVREFADVLERELPGSVRWIDEEQLLIGDTLKSEIQKAIGVRNQFFVPFLSDRSVASDWVQRELKWAIEQERKQDRTLVLPVILDDTGGEVLAQLRATWKKALSKRIGEKLTLHIHDFTSAEITSKARLLAADIKTRMAEPQGEDEPPFSTLGPMA